MNTPWSTTDSSVQKLKYVAEVTSHKTMDREDEVHKVVGEQNIKTIRKAIREGKIDDSVIRAMAKKMKGTVLGVFHEKKRKEEKSVDVFNFMLDTWYEEVLCDPGVDGVAALLDILNDEDVRQYSLAREIVPLQSPAGLILGLPENNFQLGSQDSLVFPTSQYQRYTSTSYAVGKAVVDILDTNGWEVEEDDIVDAVNTKTTDEQGQNPDQYNGVTLKVHVNKKEDKEIAGDIYVEVRVQGVCADVPVGEDLLARGVGMVLRWNMWNSNINKYDPHSIYGKEYNKDTENYSCINKWENTTGFPQIHKSDVEAVYYITIQQVFTKDIKVTLASNIGCDH